MVDPPAPRQTAHALRMYRCDSARRPASPALGDKRVSDQRMDTCFHDRMLHRPHARFATPVPANGGAAALVRSPKSERDARLSRAAARLLLCRPRSTAATDCRSSLRWGQSRSPDAGRSGGQRGRCFVDGEVSASLSRAAIARPAFGELRDLLRRANSSLLWRRDAHVGASARAPSSTESTVGSDAPFSSDSEEIVAARHLRAAIERLTDSALRPHRSVRLRSDARAQRTAVMDHLSGASGAT